HPPPPRSPTLSLHDALPISVAGMRVELGAKAIRQFERHRTVAGRDVPIGARSAARFRADGDASVAGARAHAAQFAREHDAAVAGDRKSTRLNSSHLGISYAV